MTRVYIGIGSNLGNRARHLEFAFRSLKALRETSLLRHSRIYESEPVGPGLQGPYLNAVAELETSLGPRALLDELLEIETRAGRVRREHWGPRTLDLDLLLYGEERIDEPGLEVPHPRLFERNFVLEPLAEVAGARQVCGFGVADRARQLRDPKTLWEWPGE